MSTALSEIIFHAILVVLLKSCIHAALLKYIQHWPREATEEHPTVQSAL